MLTHTSLVPLFISDELKRHLISICAPKFRLLKKKPKSKSIKPDDKFYFNNDFKHKMKRLRIPLVSMRKKKKKNKHGESNKDLERRIGSIPSKVAEDRKYLVEAAIVRIMKFRKGYNFVLFYIFYLIESLLLRRYESLLLRRHESLLLRRHILVAAPPFASHGITNFVIFVFGFYLFG